MDVILALLFVVFNQAAEDTSGNRSDSCDVVIVAIGQWLAHFLGLSACTKHVERDTLVGRGAH